MEPHHGLYLLHLFGKIRLCKNHGQTGTRKQPEVCSKTKCRCLHVCWSWLSGHCTHGDICELGHSLRTSENRAVLCAANKNFNKVYCNENLRQLVVSTFPHTCSMYNNLGKKCRYGDQCCHIHVCGDYVMGTCKEDHCPNGLSHDLSTPRTKEILEKFNCTVNASQTNLACIIILPYLDNKSKVPRCQCPSDPNLETGYKKYKGLGYNAGRRRDRGRRDRRGVQRSQDDCQERSLSESDSDNEHVHGYQKKAGKTLEAGRGCDPNNVPVKQPLIPSGGNVKQRMRHGERVVRPGTTNIDCIGAFGAAVRQYMKLNINPDNTGGDISPQSSINAGNQDMNYLIPVFRKHILNQGGLATIASLESDKDVQCAIPCYFNYQDWLQRNDSMFFSHLNSDGELESISLLHSSFRFCFQYNSHRGCAKSQEECTFIHVCKSFINGTCLSSNVCSLIHDFQDKYVRSRMKDAGFPDLKKATIRAIIYNMMPRVCFDFNHTICYKGDFCSCLHICQDWVTETCASGEKCNKKHGLEGEHTQAIIKKLNFERLPVSSLMRMLMPGMPGMVPPKQVVSGNDSNPLPKPDFLTKKKKVPTATLR